MNSDDSYLIRIVTLDSYMSSPIQGLDPMYSEFRGASISQVPVLRLFGSIPTGEKICIHIHGVFPYLYIPYDGTQDVNSQIYRIAASIDKAVNISLNQATSNTQHVYKITLVQGIPMYGYHNKKHQFFKIYLYNPILIRKVTALLMNETTLGTLYQPHEAHLNFTLQFMIDYNLHGMSNMILSKMKYRQDSKETNIDPELLLPPSVSKMTICYLEGDCLAEDILNREEVASGNIGANPGISALWADEQQRRRNKGLDSQINHLLELERTNLPPTNSHLVYKQALMDRLAVFSNEKNVIDKLNSSVYPAETPPNCHIQNASLIDSQTANSSDSSLLPSNLDETLGPAELSSMSITFDEDAQQLLQVLNDLEEQVNEKIEEDSILTQLTKDDEEEKEMEENELDFSIWLETATTPTKIIQKNDDEEISDDDLLNVTLIPQMDGCCDEIGEETKNASLLHKKVNQDDMCQVNKSTKHLKKVVFIKVVKIGRDMPDLNEIIYPTEMLLPKNSLSTPISNEKKKTVVPKLTSAVRVKKPARVNNRISLVKRKRYRKIIYGRYLTRRELKELKERLKKKSLEEIRLFEYRINKLKRQDQLAAMMRRLHKKENELLLFLEKNHQPKFRVTTKEKLRSLMSIKEIDPVKTSRVKVLSDIIVKIANYVEPTLYLTMKCPKSKCYIYNYYNSNVFPIVTKIPPSISRHPDKPKYKNFIKRVNKHCLTITNEQITATKEQKTPVKEIEVYNEENIYKAEENNDPFIFSDKYLTNIKDPDMLIDIRRKSDDDILKMAEYLRDHLKKHIRFLSSPTLRHEIEFSSEIERSISLRNITCLNTKKENLKLFYENNNYETDSNKNDCIINGKRNNLTCEKTGKYKLNESDKKYSKNNIKNNGSAKHNDMDIIENKQDDISKKTRQNAVKEPLRRSTRIKNLISLDGTVDSESTSSSEEEEQKGRKRSLRTPSRASRYKALPITLEKSPKSLSDKDTMPAVKDLVSFAETTKTETPPISKLSQNPVCDMKVKRQLFEKSANPLLNKTVVEEKLVCGYSPTIAGVENICDATNILTSNFVHNESILEDVSNSSTIFSTDSEPREQTCLNSEIRSNVDLTIAEKYDETTNYKAKEGCSKFLTQISQNFTSSSSSDYLTPYQVLNLNNTTTNIQVTEEIVKDICSQGSYKTLEESFRENSQLITIVPKFSAPTREEVLRTLDAHKLPHVSNQSPYYSNVEDVTGSVEVGFNTLKIKSKTTAHLADFESQTDSLNTFRKARVEQLPSNVKLTKTNMENMMLSYCKNTDCIITPVKTPPDSETIKAWLARKSKKTCTPEHRTQRIKIRLPTSPGAKSDDETLDVSLTLSPLTPKSSQANSSRSASPIFGDECKKRKKEIRKKILSKSLRNSLSLSQENSINNSGEISGVTVQHSYLNRSVQNLQNARAIVEHLNLTVLVMELHIRTRADLKPDPVYDSMRAIFYSILHDVPEPNLKGRNRKGVIAINSIPSSPGANSVPILNGIGIDCDITYVDSEDNLIKEFLKVINYWDPDIYAGYEIELLSWGYLIQRGYVLGINMKPLLGRIGLEHNRQREDRQRDDDSLNELKLPGRIVLDVWRLMKYEIALQSYTFESVSYHILQKRLPYYSFKDLSFWWDHRTQLYRHRTAKYYITRVVTILDLFDKLDFLGRTSELARLFGILFFEVLSRGSQFRVESMMLRLAKPLNFVAVSPNVQQRAHMKAPEYIALVLEPESKLYDDPVIVLDFQSLYPSIIIAYNYCFTTCVGRVESLGKSGPFEFGATQLMVSRNRLKKLFERNQLNFSPCGVGFVKKEVRDGIMPRMLREILDTRLMVKNSMKENKNDKILQRVLHSRQLGLKLIANVTYGYTAANFSGRMPAVELGDSVVSKGRETLQRAIAMVDSTPEWGARVVYGDTDSLFVLVPGRTRERAFEVGKQIAEAVTNDNPDPIKLKLEKVYQPCILQTKKRYVGYMYESPDQKDPVYEAKGIETVRRDGCPAVSKMLEKCLKILFETKDVSVVKKYVMKQFNKIIAGRVSIQDLTFAKEYRGAAGYRPGACVPALELTKKWTSVDKRNEPRSGERVPYVIVNGPPGLPLIRMVKSPRDLLNDTSLKPNAIYYITRVIIPPINRCFNLIGADVNTWFNQMPRKKTQYFASSVSPKKKTTISQYFSTSSCVSCEEQTQAGICQNCCNKPQVTMFTLMEKMRMWETNYQNTVKICQTCTSSVCEVRCTSLDCPIYYKRVQSSRDEQQTTFVRQLLSSSDFDF